MKIKIKLLSLFLLMAPLANAQSIQELYQQVVQAPRVIKADQVVAAPLVLSSQSKIAANMNVTFNAAKQIVLLPGFKSKPMQGKFYASIKEGQMGNIEGLGKVSSITQNPAYKSVTIRYTFDAAEKYFVKVIDSKGLTLDVKSIEGVSGDSVPLDLSVFNDRFYIVQLILPDGKIEGHKVLVVE